MFFFSSYLFTIFSRNNSWTWSTAFSTSTGSTVHISQLYFVHDVDIFPQNWIIFCILRVNPTFVYSSFTSEFTTTLTRIFLSIVTNEITVFFLCTLSVSEFGINERLLASLKDFPSFSPLPILDYLHNTGFIFFLIRQNLTLNARF